MSLPKISSLGIQCCGCAVCSSVCPVCAITMKPDACGFPLSHVDEEVCIGCGRCDGVCPCLTESKRQTPLRVYGVQSTEKTVLEVSSSGGMFSLLALNILETGGTVYGACFENGFKGVRHERIASAKELNRCARSKYVQSSISKDIYQRIEDDLAAGKQVMFVGTQCQASAAKLRFDQCKGVENLLVVDVICHGVPSPELWKRYLCYLECRAGAQAKAVNFRKKSPSWETYSVSVQFENESVYETKYFDDWYMKAFLKNASLRDACFCCPAKGIGKSDITLGDYWGFESVDTDCHIVRSLGVSAVLLNTEKGIAAFEGISQGVVCFQSSLSSVSKGNPSLINSVRPYGMRRDFIKALAEGAEIETLQKRWKFSTQLHKRFFAVVRKAKRALMRRFR